jgi:hypothetical protein
MGSVFVAFMKADTQVFFLFQDSWMYHLTVVSGGGPNAGTQYEQLVQKLMETDGDPSKLVLIS